MAATMEKRKEFLSNVSAIQNEESTSIIGYLTWYSIGDDLYDREDLRKGLLTNGIKEKYLPNPIRPVDAFKRATKAVELSGFKEDASASEYRNFIVRDVVNKGDKQQRNIVVEKVNQDGERLDYDSEGAKMFFDKKNEQFTFVANDMTAYELAEEAQKHYEMYLKAHNGAVVRASVVNYLNGLSPTPVRPSGGVYFVPVQHGENLRKIVRFVSDLPRGESHMIPLVNDDDNRKMIKDKVKDNLSKILEQCRFAISDDGTKLQKGQVRAIIEDARRIVSQFKDYKELLQDTVSDLESSVELVRNSINLVLEKVDN
jgi:hypothetical protein